MTEPADDDGLDRMMGRMRTMFRELGDEEPPARGLDALMAAARTKAAEMAPAPEKESWWRRTLAMLTRPPVLAAATVIVLVGSTVMLTRRGGLETAAIDRKVEREAPPSPVRQEKGSVDPSGTPELRAGYAKDEAKATAGDAPSNIRDRQVTSRPRPPVARPESPPEPAPERGLGPEPQGGLGPEPQGGLGPEPQGVPERQETGERPNVAPVEDAEPRIITEGVVRNQGGAPSNDSVTATRPTAPTGRGPTPNSQASVTQLMKQAETAAGRNDCAAVKATAERIRKLDATAYKTRVVTQAAIKRCL